MANPPQDQNDQREGLSTMMVSANVAFLSFVLSLLTLAVTFTGMFVTLRERVQNHEERLKYHANEILALQNSCIDSGKQYARIEELLFHIQEDIKELKKG